MERYKFEGDIDNISEPQLEFINNVIKEMGFRNSKVSFQPVGKVGDNYGASVKRITIEGDHESCTMVAKIAPTYENTHFTTGITLLFVNEHLMYAEVLPKLVQLQKDAGIPEDGQLRYAKCYGSLPGSAKEVILLEDLKASEYIMLDRYTPLSNECVKSVLKNFALLHSLSHVLKHKEPDTYENYKKKLTDRWAAMGADDGLKVVIENLENDTIAVLEDLEHKKFVRNKIANSLYMMAKVSETKYDSTYAVIQQGDAWTNNIMFRTDDNKTSSVMIDYQLSCVTSPVCDLLYMIFSCTDYSSRRQHYNDWIDYYYAEFDKSLSHFGLKANVVYPREELDAELKEYGKYQFGQAALLASVIVRKTNDAEKMMDSLKNAVDDDVSEMAEASRVASYGEESKTHYRDKIVGLINSFTELGYL